MKISQLELKECLHQCREELSECRKALHQNDRFRLQLLGLLRWALNHGINHDELIEIMGGDKGAER